MSLITQCPACGTMFRIVPDQLRISEGWVRCGQCDEAFDANAYLRTLDEAVLTPPVTQASAPQTAEPTPQPLVPVATSVAAPPVVPEHPHVEPPQESPLYDWGPLLQPPPVDARPMAPEVPEPANGEAASAGDAVVIEEWGDVSPGRDGFASDSVPLDAELADGAVADMVADRVAHDMPLPTSLSFMPAPVKASRLGRKSLWALCGLLSLLLLLQLGLFERDRLAATAPALRPVLTTLCAALDCAIAAPRQIESIAIDNSAFTSVKAGVYKLSVTLKNAAAIELATPALELTLSDLQDQTVLRRVIQPADVAAASSIAAGAELSLNVALSVKPEALANRVSGYKLLAFYP